MAGAAPLLFQFDHDDTVCGDARDDLPVLQRGVPGDDAHHLSDDADGVRARARRGGGGIVVRLEFSDL